MNARTIPVLLAAAGACGPARPPAPAAAAAPAAHAPTTAPPVRADQRQLQAPALEGSWALRAVEQLRPGPRLQLAIDSVRDSTFRVRVAFLMQGDVGLDPTRFEPTRGEITPDGTIHLTIQLKGRTEPTGRLAGTLAESGDTIRLNTYEWSGTNQTAGGVHWLLVRQP
jgi:hypothetical protein